MENSEIFIEALRKEDKNTVEEMLDKQPELVNARSAQGLSAVLTAIYYGQNEWRGY